MMERVGNKIANEYWEALLPQDYQRPNTEDTVGMSRFIRQKYDMRKLMNTTTKVIKAIHSSNNFHSRDQALSISKIRLFMMKTLQTFKVL